MVAKRTQRDDEDCVELRKTLTVEAEALQTAAGNMCGTVMRGTAAPPGSSSSRQGSCRNLGDLQPPAAAKAVPGRFGKARSRSRTGRSKESDGCIVPMKPRTTPADRSGAESVEGRRPVEGRARANACPGHRAGTGMSPTARVHGPELDGPPKPRMPVASDLRQEPGAGKPHAGICAGAGGNSCPYRDNFLHPDSYINQKVSLARRRAIHVQRVAALRDLISVA